MCVPSNSVPASTSAYPSSETNTANAATVAKSAAVTMP
jgi:hypothetical protein